MLCARVPFLSLLALLVLAAPSSAQNEDLSAAYLLLKPGAAFGYFESVTHPERIRTADFIREKYAKENIHFAELLALVDDSIVKGLRESTPDKLARAIAISFAEWRAFVLRLAVLQEVNLAYRVSPDLPESAPAKIALLNGQIVIAPKTVALLVSTLNIGKTAQGLRDAATRADISGHYDVSANGICNLAIPEITIAQREFFVEAVANNRLVAYGAVGTAKAYLVIAELRLPTIIERPGSAPFLDDSAEPIELLEGSLPDDTGTIKFSDLSSGDCEITLRPTP